MNGVSVIKSVWQDLIIKAKQVLEFPIENLFSKKTVTEIDKNAEVIDWDEDIPISAEDSYQAMRRALQRTQGFSLFFVRCSPIQATYLIDKIQNDLPQKQFKTLTLENETENLYDLVAKLPEKQNTNILFIRGLENSLLRYEEKESLGLTLSSQSPVYGGTWAGIPRILGHLNLSRERFRESFSIAFVFLLPEFALRYFIRRAPDFFDWRSGVYDFPTQKESVNSEAYRLVYEQDTDLETYGTWTSQERLQRLTEIRAYLSESPDNEKSSELWYKKGLIHHFNNQFEEAITSYDQALKFIPDDHLAWHSRGIALANLGRHEEAITSWDNALKFKPDYPDTWYGRGIALRNLGRYEESITSYDNALKIKPDYHQAWYNRGNTLGDLGRYEEAIASYDNALKIKPDDHEAWYGRGITLGNLGRNEEKIASYDNALKFKPDYHEAWYGRGITLGNLGRNEEAIASYDNTLKIKPDDHEAWNGRGLALVNLGRYEEAITSYDNALKILKIKPNDYDIVNRVGSTLQKMEKYEEAIQWYNHYIDKFNIDLAIENRSDFDLLIINRNSIINKIYSITERINFYQQEIAKSKNNNNPVLEVLMLKEISDCLKKDLKDDKTAYKFLFKSWKLAESLQLKIAESLFRELQKIYLYPDAFIKLGKLDKANDFIADWLPIFKETNDTNGIDKFVVYEKTIETNLFCNQGNELLNLERNEEAIASYDRILKIEPDFHTAWYNRGDALGNLGRYEEAIASYDEALKIKPNDYKIVNRIGSTLQKLEKYEEAIQWYDQYIDKFKIDLAIENSSDFDLLIINRNSIINKIYSVTERINFYQQEIAKSKNNNNPVLEVVILKEISDCLKKDLKDDKTAYKFLFKSWKLADSLRLKTAESLFRELQKIYLYPDAFIKVGRLDKANEFIANWLPIFREANDTNGIDKFVVYEKTIKTNLFCNQGNELFNLGRYEEAIASYDEALKIKSKYHLAWYGRGNALFNLGRYIWFNPRKTDEKYKEAITSYDEVLKIKPDYVDAYYKKACIYALQKNTDLAIKNLKEAIKRDSKYLEMAKTDTDFDKIRNDSSFINLLNIEH